jgi:hypothetical protein
MNAMDREKKSTKKISARLAMPKRLSRKRRYLRHKLIRVHPMEKSISSMERPTKCQILRQVMLSSKYKNNHMKRLKEREQIF